MQRFFIFLAYDGAHYCGWQNQPNAITVQQTIEEAMSLILRRPMQIVGAGRTDTGVHASMMVAHFDIDPDAEFFQPVSLFVNKLNGVLPSDIAIQRIVEVRPDAHARFDAISRTYKYFTCFEKDPFRSNFHLRLRHPLDFEKMNEAASMLLQYDDFTSFCKLHSDNKTNICHISRCEWQQIGNEWIFTIRADRFLRNMVRAIVGTLLNVGRGRMTVAQFRQIVESRSRPSAGASAPANGLFLSEIEYREEIFV